LIADIFRRYAFFAIMPSRLLCYAYVYAIIIDIFSCHFQPLTPRFRYFFAIAAMLSPLF